MTTGVISQRYARALMNLAARGGEVDAVMAGLDDVADGIGSSPELGAFLADANVAQTAKMSAVTAILERSQAPELVRTFGRYLASKRRFPLLEEIRAVFHRLADERQGRAQAEVTVAAPLAPAQEQAIREKLAALSGKEITLAVTVDPAIIGGAITKVGSSVRDGSLRNHLESIRHTIMEG